MQGPGDLSTAVPPPPRQGLVPPRDIRRSMNFALFLASVAWYTCARALAASAAEGFAFRFGLADYQPLMQAVCLLFLVFSGLLFLRVLERGSVSPRAAFGLPQRLTSGTEWTTGAALGWGLSVASVLPAVLTRNLGVQLWVAPRAFLLASIGLASLAASTLAIVLALYGFGLQRLIEAIGPTRSTFVVMAVVAIHASLTSTPAGTADGARILVAILAALLLCLCWIRTQAVWVGWGVYFAWAASTALLFGLPIGGRLDYMSVIGSRAFGPVWLTGGDYGPMDAAFSIVLLLVAIAVLVRITDDFAWEYTRRPIIAAGYPVDVPPPAAHTEVEKTEVARTPTLVQILPAPPPPPAVTDREM